MPKEGVAIKGKVITILENKLTGEKKIISSENEIQYRLLYNITKALLGYTQTVPAIEHLEIYDESYVFIKGLQVNTKNYSCGSPYVEGCTLVFRFVDNSMDNYTFKYLVLLAGADQYARYEYTTTQEKRGIDRLTIYWYITLKGV